MNESRVPDWIKQFKDDEAKKESVTQAAAQAELQKQIAIEKLAQGYWKRFLEELKITVDALSSIDVRATLSNVSTPTNAEEAYRIELTAGDLIPKITYINLFYLEGVPYIRLCPFQGNQFRMYLRSHDSGELGLLYNNQIMNPAEAARSIIEPLTRFVLNNS